MAGGTLANNLLLKPLTVNCLSLSLILPFLSKWPVRDASSREFPERGKMHLVYGARGVE